MSAPTEEQLADIGYLIANWRSLRDALPPAAQATIAKRLALPVPAEFIMFRLAMMTVLPLVDRLFLIGRADFIESELNDIAAKLAVLNALGPSNLSAHGQ